MNPGENGHHGNRATIDAPEKWPVIAAEKLLQRRGRDADGQGMNATLAQQRRRRGLVRCLVPLALVVGTMFGAPVVGARTVATNEVQSLIDGACQGGVVDLGSRTYEVAPTLIISGCQDLTLRNGTIDGSAAASRDRRQVRITGSTNVRIEAVTILGPGEQGGLAARERQHAIQIEASDTVTVTRSVIRDAGSDAVIVNDKRLRRRSTDIEVSRSDIFGTGRQCISGEGVVGLRIVGNRFSDCQRSVFDFEAAGGGAQDVLIADNDVDAFTRRPNQIINISNDGEPGNADPFLVDGNRVYGADLTVTNRSPMVHPVLTDNQDNLSPLEFPGL